jgi:hypothetical protein
MRSAFFIFVVAVLAYGLWSYYVGNPDFTKAAIVQQVHLKVSPAEPEPATPQAPVASAGPNLAYITVVKGSALTNAKVKSVTATGIVFICDQGLIEVPFGNLPPEFGEYYMPKVAADAVPTSVPTSLPPSPPVQHRVEKSAAQDAQDELTFTRTRMALRDRIKSDELVMDQWYQQSSFRNPAISESEYQTTKADLDAATLQLAELEANGPAH